jgi:hypothetical protein
MLPGQKTREFSSNKFPIESGQSMLPCPRPAFSVGDRSRASPACCFESDLGPLRMEENRETGIQGHKDTGIAVLEVDHGDRPWKEAETVNRMDK